MTTNGTAFTLGLFIGVTIGLELATLFLVL